MSKALSKHPSRASYLKGVICLQTFGCFACLLILVCLLWDVLGVYMVSAIWSLQEVAVVGWVLGLLYFIGMSKALSKHPSRASCLNGVICIHI